MIDAGEAQEYAQLINDSGQHLLSVVNGILDMSKMESGNFRNIAGTVCAARRAPQLLQPAGAEGEGNAFDLVTAQRGSAVITRRPPCVQADSCSTSSPMP